MAAAGPATLRDLALLAMLAGGYLWFLRAARPAAASISRTARYRRWLARAPLTFGAVALLALAISGDLAALYALPDALTVLVDPARRIAGLGNDPRQIQVAVLAALVGSGLIGLAIARRRSQRGSMLPRPMAGLVPQRRTEIGWAALLALTAALVEELYFRLALPLVLARTTGSASGAMALAALMFAYAHRGHGWPGMALALLTGATLALVYLATGDLWFAIMVHALLNLNGLVLRPLLAIPRGAGREISSSAATPS